MILIAIGANLPTQHGRSALETCEIAVATLSALPQIRLIARSHWYETDAHPPSDQPRYVNGVVAIESTSSPVHLLENLQMIELLHGRERSVPNAARTLDLDIVDMNGLIRNGPDPILPHPRAHERAFVLRPLLDVAPHWRHPISGLTVQALLDAVLGQLVRPLACSHLRNGTPAPI